MHQSSFLLDKNSSDSSSSTMMKCQISYTGREEAMNVTWTGTYYKKGKLNPRAWFTKKENLVRYNF